MHDHDARPASSPAGRSPAEPQLDAEHDGQHGHSMWWMVVCCAPMVLLALALLLGAFGPR